MNLLPWVFFPYLVIGVFVVGHVWRWKRDRFAIGTPGEPQERTWLLRGSVLFHVGLLGVIAGHVVGLLVPAGVTARLGIGDHAYHLQAAVIGGAAGLACWTGILILTCRRVFVGAVRRSGTLFDVATDLMLLVVVTLGNCLTLGYQLFVDEYDYRETVSVWVRQLPLGHPDPSLMSGIPWIFQAHILAAFTLLALWPFGRLVHVWTGPLFVLARLRAPQVPAAAATWADVTAVRLLKLLQSQER